MRFQQQTGKTFGKRKSPSSSRNHTILPCHFITYFFFFLPRWLGQTLHMKKKSSLSLPVSRNKQMEQMKDLMQSMMAWHDGRQTTVLDSLSLPKSTLHLIRMPISPPYHGFCHLGSLHLLHQGYLLLFSWITKPKIFLKKKFKEKSPANYIIPILIHICGTSALHLFTGQPTESSFSQESQHFSAR